MSSARHVVTYGIVPFTIIFGGSIFVNDNILETSSIIGSSMTPTLSPNYHTTGSRDFVLWKKWNPLNGLKRGDIVLFHSPQMPERLSVKRVVALAGDTVLLDPRRRPEDVENGRRNDAARGWDVQFNRNGGRWQVPEGHVWVEGDNWRSSNDSNAYGPISRSLVVGRALGLVWPLGQIGNKPWEQWKSRTKVVPETEKTNREDDANGLWDSH